VHFGLGDANRIDRLEIRWPSGAAQELADLAGDRHILVEEGKAADAAVTTIVPGKTIEP
jgi:hypothetical protein